MKAWTVLAYFAADNSLSAEMVWSLQEILASGPSEEVAVLAAYDSPVPGVGTVRFDFQQMTDFNSAEITGVAENFADPATLTSFLQQGLAQYPSPQHLIILSGFGNGFTAGLLQDEHPHAEMTIPNLRQALAPLGTVRILGLDCCLLSMVEIASELSGIVQYLIANEGATPASGWPYRQILTQLKANPTMNAAAAADNILTEFLRFYEDYAIAGVSVDQAVTDVAQTGLVEVAVKQLVTALTNELSDGLHLKPELLDALLLAHYKSQSYRFEQHTDLWDFCLCLEQLTEDQTVRAACAAVIAALGVCVVKSRWTGAAYQHSHGLSIYFPWAVSELPLIASYKDLVFAKRTGWGGFLGAYVLDTQRMMRGPQRSGEELFPGGDLLGRRDDPRMEDVKDDPRMEDAKDDPRMEDAKDLGGGCGVLLNKVKNPPDHYYRQV